MEDRVIEWVEWKFEEFRIAMEGPYGLPYTSVLCAMLLPCLVKHTKSRYLEMRR